MKKNLFRGLLLGGHDGGSDLAQSDTVSPSGAAKDESFRRFPGSFFPGDEGGTVQMGRREPSPDFQLFSNDNRSSGTDNLQPNDPARPSPIQRLEVKYIPKLKS